MQAVSTCTWLIHIYLYVHCIISSGCVDFATKRFVGQDLMVMNFSVVFGTKRNFRSSKRWFVNKVSVVVF